MQTLAETRSAEAMPAIPAQTTPREVYDLLGALGERLFLEAVSLCDNEKEAAAWASANLVRSLEERRLLARMAKIP
jgi:hypothetical protein